MCVRLKVISLSTLTKHTLGLHKDHITCWAVSLPVARSTEMGLVKLCVRLGGSVIRCEHKRPGCSRIRGCGNGFMLGANDQGSITSHGGVFCGVIHTLLGSRSHTQHGSQHVSLKSP